MYSCNPSTQQADVGVSHDQGQAGLHSNFKNILDNIVKTYLEKRKFTLIAHLEQVNLIIYQLHTNK